VASLREHLCTRRRWLYLWSATSLALLAAGDLWRAHAFHSPDPNRYQLSHLAYSDIYPLYFIHDLASHHLPYVQTQIEYPVVTGFIMWATALAPGVDAYFWANAALLAACALGILYLLAELQPAGRLWRFALAPMLFFYGSLNWDLVSVLELVAAIYFVRKSKFGWAGVLLALGMWTKLYPGFILPIVLAYVVRSPSASDGPRAVDITRRKVNWHSPAMRLLVTFAAVTLALNLPLALINFQGWSFPFTFQIGRDVNPDSIWFHVPNVSLGLVYFWFLSIFTFGMGWLLLRSAWDDRWEVAALLAILLFLLVTRDYSPQYDIWILPFLALLCCPTWVWIAFGVADSAYYSGIFLWLYQNAGGHLAISLSQGNTLLGVTVWGREVVLGIVGAWALLLLIEVRLPVFTFKQAAARTLREEVGHADGPES
jgi:hypothetical protein